MGRIHSDAKKAIKKKLIEEFSELEVEKGFAKLPKEKPWGWAVAAQIAKTRPGIVETRQAWEIILNHLTIQFDQTDRSKWPSGKLSKVADIEGISDAILEFIENLPQRYFLYCQIGGASNLEAMEVISKKIQIVAAKDDPVLSGIRLEEPSMTAAMLAGLSGANAIPRRGIKNEAYIRIEASGYTSGALTDIAVADAISELKCLLYLGINRGVFKRFASAWGLPKPFVFVIRDDESEASPITLDLGEEFSNFVGALFLAEKDHTQPTRNARLNAIGHLLSAEPDDGDRMPIAAAAEWGFDSSISRNETVSFIQLCVGLEAILGDNTSESLTKTLADRCAYLLEKRVTKRRAVREQFTNLYKIRSKLVHGRTMRLDTDARALKVLGDQGSKICSSARASEFRYLRRAMMP